MSRVIKKEARRHQYLLKSDKLTDVDEDSLLELYTPYLNENVQQESLSLLSEMLSKHHGTNAIILIDEYDVPLDKSHQQNKRMNEHVGILQKKLCIFTKVYFSNTLYLTSKIVYTMPEMNQIIV